MNSSSEGGNAQDRRGANGAASVSPIRPDVAPPAGQVSFEAWYRREHPRFVAALLLATGNVAVAAEAVDEAFARALERWDRVRVMDSPSGWVFQVASNVSRRIAWRAALERSLLRRHLPEVDVPAPAGEIWAVVATLPRREREVVALRHLGGLRENDIACVLGISRSTVSTTLRSAHRRLSALVDDQGDDE